jgi:uncharacterized protein (DUF433 family)
MKNSPIVAKDPEIMSGMLVFAGTRVPVQILIDYLTGGASIEKFLDQDFCKVERVAKKET